MLTSNFRDVLLQMNVRILQVVRVDVDLDELEQAETVFSYETGQTAGEGPRQQNVGRLAHRLVDLLVRQVEIFRKLDAAQNELSHLTVHLRHHRREGKLFGEGRFLERGT